MPIFSTQVPAYRPAKDVVFEWDTFRRGLNTLLKDNEIQKDEVSQMDNMAQPIEGYGFWVIRMIDIF